MSRTIMTVEEFETLAEIHGGDIDRWPVERRAEAARLAAREAQARRALARAAQIDRLLDADMAEEPSAALMARVLGDAAEIAAARRSAPRARRGGEAPAGWRTWLEQLVLGSGGLAAAGFGATAVAGLVAGVLASSAASVAADAPVGYMSVAAALDRAVGDPDDDLAEDAFDDPSAFL